MLRSALYKPSRCAWSRNASVAETFTQLLPTARRNDAKYCMLTRFKAVYWIHLCHKKHYVWQRYPVGTERKPEFFK